MKLRFLMSPHRKPLVRDKVIDKKWIYLERDTLHRIWSISEAEALKYGVVSFYGLGNFIG